MTRTKTAFGKMPEAAFLRSMPGFSADDFEDDGIAAPVQVALAFTRHPCSALTAEFGRPRPPRVVFANPAEAEADFASRIYHRRSPASPSSLRTVAAEFPTLSPTLLS